MSAALTRIDAHFVAAGKYHDIDFARLELLKLIYEHPEIRTSVSNDYSDIARLEACSLLITYTCDLMPSAAELVAIKAWLERGGRWLALHGTNSILEFTDGGVATPELRPDVMELLGTQFKAHPPIGPFTVEVCDSDHELSRGIADFEVIDELYLSKTLAPIRTLMRTTFTGEATGFVDANWQDAVVPILYLRDIGKGQILYNTLGHCRGHHDLPMVPFYAHPERCAWNYPVYYELLRRGLRWAMNR
ncbi:ThuA domain-containing protein [Sphingosinicellaceae bacterium]|nr:ThuA domain-containing protein [Sphingosinicellaceae bacterium]